MQIKKLPLIAIAIGDPAGIGAEIVAKSLANPETAGFCRPIAVGPAWVLKNGMTIAGVDMEVITVKPSQIDEPPGDAIVLVDEGWPEQDISLGEISLEAGNLSVKMVRTALSLVQKGFADALVYGPLNKESLKLAGSGYSAEIGLLAGWLKEKDVGEVNYVGGLYTTRASSHLPFKDIASFITSDRILRAARRLHITLIRAGVKDPVIGVAALNPHGGEHGVFGNEEQEVITPAVLSARKEGINAVGPYPADTIFVRAGRGDFHGVVTMYHDQGQIAMKLMGFDKIVSIQGGLSIVATTPSHGTAFDIAGKGIADPNAFMEALRVAARMASGD